MKKILIVAAHPDDETLGCGGTILKCKEKGEVIYWLIMTNISTQDGYAKDPVRARQGEIEMITKKYGFKDVFKLDFPTAKLDTIPRFKLIEKVSKALDVIMPDTVYIPSRADVHSDHKITFDVMMSSTKGFRFPSIKNIMAYEVISETEFSPPLFNNIFIPNAFSDISGYLDKKMDIMQIYKTELGEHPFPRNSDNLKALATFRGATAGCKHAEAFMVLKEVW